MIEQRFLFWFLYIHLLLRLLQKDALNLEAIRMEALHYLCREGNISEVSLFIIRLLSITQPL